MLKYFQAFTDELKLKIHYLKHQSTKLGSLIDIDQQHQTPTHRFVDQDTSPTDTPTDLSSLMAAAQKSANSNLEMFLNSSQNVASGSSPATLLNSAGSATSFADQFSHQMQNLHLAQLASFYQQNPFYYQNLYPFLSGMEQQKLLTSNLAGGMPGAANTPAMSSPFGPFGVGGQFDLSVAAAAAAAAAAVANNQTPKTTMTKSQQKRKSTALMDEQMTGNPYQMGGTGPARKVLKTNHKSGGSVSGNSSTGSDIAAGQASNNANNFKMFKDEPIPQGYLKFRFNEDCNFPNCGYRNHQSHFHCCRTDCYYSFCDKTRFVQHTARHERLDKLMGDDFKQYRANMRCGHVDCAYNKNIGKFFIVLKKDSNCR